MSIFLCSILESRPNERVGSSDIWLDRRAMPRSARFTKHVLAIVLSSSRSSTNYGNSGARAAFDQVGRHAPDPPERFARVCAWTVLGWRIL
jgi:hypothetical protein